MELDRTRERGPDADLQAITSPVTLAHATNFLLCGSVLCDSVRLLLFLSFNVVGPVRPWSAVYRLASTVYSFLDRPSLEHGG